MKKYNPIVGAEIVGRSGSRIRLLSIVHSIHEKWDGSGYPDASPARPFLSARDPLRRLMSGRGLLLIASTAVLCR